jgi:hypothetical protein
MATQTDTARDQLLTIDELKARATAIADLLAEAFNLVEQAKNNAGILARDLAASHKRKNFYRCDYEVTILGEAIATDLGATDEHGEFDLDLTPKEARDLVALMEFASSPDTVYALAKMTRQDGAA